MRLYIDVGVASIGNISYDIIMERYLCLGCMCYCCGVLQDIPWIPMFGELCYLECRILELLQQLLLFNLLSSLTTQKSHWFAVSSLTWNAAVVSVSSTFFWSFLNPLRSEAALIATMKLDLVVPISKAVSALVFFL